MSWATATERGASGSRFPKLHTRCLHVMRAQCVIACVISCTSVITSYTSIILYIYHPIHQRRCLSGQQGLTFDGAATERPAEPHHWRCFQPEPREFALPSGLRNITFDVAVTERPAGPHLWRCFRPESRECRVAERRCMIGHLSLTLGDVSNQSFGRVP